MKTIKRNEVHPASYGLFQEVKLKGRKEPVTIVGVEYIPPIHALIEHYGECGWRYTVSLIPVFDLDIEDLLRMDLDEGDTMEQCWECDISIDSAGVEK